MSEFWAMGGYAFYVWGAYGISVAVLAVLGYLSWRRGKRTAARLEELKAAAPHRRNRRRASQGTEDHHGAQ